MTKKEAEKRLEDLLNYGDIANMQDDKHDGFDDILETYEEIIDFINTADEGIVIIEDKIDDTSECRIVSYTLEVDDVDTTAFIVLTESGSVIGYGYIQD